MHLYVIGTPPAGSEFVSLGRSWSAPARIVAFTTVDAAVFAEASGEVLVPGYFIGGESPGPMSSSSADQIIAALADAGLEAHFVATTWQGVLALWATESSLWVEQLDAKQAAVLRRVFDRHADPAIVGRRPIYRVDVGDGAVDQPIIHVVLERERDIERDFTGAERAVAAFRSRERAEARALELGAEVVEAEVTWRRGPC